MTRRSGCGGVDQRGSAIPPRDPIARPEASGTVELGRITVRSDDPVSASTPRPITHDGVGGARNDGRQGYRIPRMSGSTWCEMKTAMEMTSLWKPKSGFHRDLEISHRTRDSHIPTADHPLSQKEDDEERRRLGVTDHQINWPQDRRILGHIQDRQE
mgnify:CR=1 FL=1